MTSGCMKETALTSQQIQNTAAAHLWCRYRAKRTVRQYKDVLTEHTAETETYLLALVQKFETKYDVTVTPQRIPFLPESKIRKL